MPRILTLREGSRRGGVVMRLWLTALAVLVLSSCQPQQGASGPSCRVARVTDGDTLQLSCDGRDRKVRLLGVDTPELFHPSCTAERLAAQVARQELARLVQVGPISSVRFQGNDRYGRDLARISVAGQDLSNAMIEGGFGLAYSGGRRPNWCDRQN